METGILVHLILTVENGTRMTWVVQIEALLDQLGVGLVLGEDDRLAEPVTTLDVDATLHQLRERLVRAPFAQRRHDVEFRLPQQAKAQAPIRRKPSARAAGAKWLGHRTDKTQCSLCIPKLEKSCFPIELSAINLVQRA